MVEFDNVYLKILMDRIAVCKTYKPKFGQGGSGLAFAEFQALYSADPLYSWFGLDNPLMYAAHKAAGGITSVYRQIGIGVEELFRQILIDHLGLNDEQVIWSYETLTSSQRIRTLKLDGRIEPEHVQDATRRQIIQAWIAKAAKYLQIDPHVASVLKGVVVEVRQGYKSKDSKRQNADITNAAEAYTKGYLPVLLVLSTQIDSDIVERYERGKWLVLRGSLGGDTIYSTYAYMRDIIGYDLAAFFERNSQQLREFTVDVLENLLKAEA